MNREQLAHVLRAAATIAEDDDILVIGSQAILGTHEASSLPEEATRSMEADIAFFDDPGEQKSDKVDGAIGESSHFFEQFGYYGQGVGIETAHLPVGWQARLVRFQREDALPSKARCLEPHDLVVAKLTAEREKDLEFATALLAAGLVRVETLLKRAAMLELPGARIKRVRQAIERCNRATEADPQQDN